MAEKSGKKIVLDGRTGEGGGQLVRIAACLSAVTGTPIHVHNVRGNRGGSRGGGKELEFPTAIFFCFELTEIEV